MRFDDILFLEVDDVLEAHAVGIARFGGSSGLRDPGLLESAVMAARSGYYGSLAELAAVYAHGIAKNHPFIDGNKRAALSAAGNVSERSWLRSAARHGVGAAHGARGCRRAFAERARCALRDCDGAGHPHRDLSHRPGAGLRVS